MPSVNAEARLEEAVGHFQLGKSFRECERLTGINCKRVEREVKRLGLSKGSLVALVENKAKIDAEMSQLSKSDARIVETEAALRQRDIEFFNNAARANVKQAMAAECENQLDYKHRSETINKGREAVLGKAPDVAIQVNNNIRLEDLLADI